MRPTYFFILSILGWTFLSFSALPESYTLGVTTRNPIIIHSEERTGSEEEEEILAHGYVPMQTETYPQPLCLFPAFKSRANLPIRFNLIDPTLPTYYPALDHPNDISILDLRCLGATLMREIPLDDNALQKAARYVGGQFAFYALCYASQHPKFLPHTYAALAVFHLLLNLSRNRSQEISDLCLNSLSLVLLYHTNAVIQDIYSCQFQLHSPPPLPSFSKQQAFGVTAQCLFFQSMNALYTLFTVYSHSAERFSEGRLYFSHTQTTQAQANAITRSCPSEDCHVETLNHFIQQINLFLREVKSDPLTGVHLPSLRSLKNFLKTESKGPYKCIPATLFVKDLLQYPLSHV